MEKLPGSRRAVFLWAIIPASVGTGPDSSQTALDWEVPFPHLPTLERMRKRLEFALVWTLVKLLGFPPRRRRPRGWVRCIGRVAFLATPRLRQAGHRNLALAFPAENCSRARTDSSQSLPKSGLAAGRVLPDARLHAREHKGFIRYDGLEHYLAARDRGKGVLVLTGHLGAWELSSFYHSLMGYPMSIVIRRLDNPLVDHLVNRIRCLHGNQVLHKDDFARGLLACHAPRARRSAS